MAGIDFSKPIGPLPTGAWIAVVAAGIGLVYWSRTHSTASSTTSAADTSTVADTIGTGPGWVAVVPPTTAPDPGSVGAITTNDQWSVLAITWLIAQGIQPTIADAAIRQYIQGIDFSSPQYQSIVDMALRHFGAPPQTLPPQTKPPGPIIPPGGRPGPIGPPVRPPNPPPPKPKPKPPVPPPAPHPTPGSQQRRFTVGHWPAMDGSLSGIAVLVYGNASRWPDIYNANRALIGPNPNLIQPGMVLIIP